MNKLIVAMTLVGSVAYAANPPPDPRRGERLDGRKAPEKKKSVARAILEPPRLLVHAILAPVAAGVSEGEKHHVWSRIYWALNQEDENRGVRPVLKADTWQVPLLGAEYFDKTALGPGSYFDLGAATWGVDNTVVRVRGRGASGFGFSAMYARRNDVPFNGVEGALPSQMEVTRFAYSGAFGRLDWHAHLFRNSSFDLGGNVEARSFENGVSRGGDPPIADVYAVNGMIDESMVPGFNGGVRRLFGDALLTLDSRENPRFGGGGLLQVYGAYAHGFADDPSEDVTIGGTAGWAWNLHDRMLMLRLKTGTIQPFGDRVVPFTSLLSPGGDEGVRGLPGNLVRANNILVASGDYHWLLNPWMDGELFVDYGGGWIGQHPMSGQMTPSFGLGLRFYSGNQEYWKRSPFSQAYIAWAPNQSFMFVVHLNDW